MENDYGPEFEIDNGGDNLIIDNFDEVGDGAPELEMVDTSAITPVAQHEHSVEFDKIQKHLLQKIGASGVKTEPNLPDEEPVTFPANNIMIEGIDDQIEPSARIEHGGVDGAINFRFDNNKYINQNNIIKEDALENNDESVNYGQNANIDFGDIEIENLPTVNENDGVENDDEDGDDVILFIEYKYCTICHIEQPLRCKHCKRCDHCVATHDHHCPWIGNCVGERNRLWFFYFLLFQFFQLLVGLTICCQIVIWNKDDEKFLSAQNQILILFLFLVCIGFLLFVTPLLIF